MQEGSPGAWVLAAAAGDQTAWGLLIERYNSMVWSIARSYNLSTPDASDVVQTTWLRLVEHLGRINDPEHVGSWLATTTRNECLVHLRRHGRHGSPTEDLTAVIDVRDQPGDALVVGERETTVWSALHQISERCRRLLRILASDPPPSYQEVGAVLEMPVGSIGPTRARCLDRLRQCIGADPRSDDLLDPR